LRIVDAGLPVASGRCMNAPTHIEIRHNEAQHRFEAQVDGHLCRLDYLRDGDLLRIHHTEVPRPLAGRGMAARLVQAAVAHAREAGLRIQPLCSYVRAWMRRHPEHSDLIGG
jgi:uncharacterized protein